MLFNTVPRSKDWGFITELPAKEGKRLWQEWMDTYHEPWRKALDKYEEENGTVTWEWNDWRPTLEVPDAPFDPDEI